MALKYQKYVVPLLPNLLVMPKPKKGQGVFIFVASLRLRAK
jgi:hypothetical protein